MQPHVEFALKELLAGRHLSAETMQRAIGDIMDGGCTEVETAALLTALRLNEETDAEIAGAAAAMRARAAHIVTTRTGLLDTCGTGGDGLHTFNISTATAIVTAACGVPVAKHGNKGVSSASGSADVLQELGVNIELTPAQAGECLDAIGLCFCYARTCHAAMRHVAGVRAELKFRTIFNLLGPLTNPAGAEYQLLGASRIATAAKLARAAAQLGVRRALVVCGNDELDEVSLWGETAVFDVASGSVKELVWRAADFGLNECRVEQLRVSSPQESAAVIRSVLGGETGPARDIVLANVAAALLCVGEASSLREGVAAGERAIDSGIAAALLVRLAEWRG